MSKPLMGQLTFGMAYTNEPKAVTEEELDGDVEVRNIKVEVARDVNWRFMVV